MPEKGPRKLVFFVCDDNDLEIPLNCEIAIWRAGEDDDDPLQPSVNRWVTHCRQANATKDISFDALSIDTFFSEDGSDPSMTLDPELRSGVRKMIPSGLYHGLAAMARRAAQDRYGNIMPFAWEVRTASPSVMEQLTGAQQAEIIRVYGLLLAIATPHADEQKTGFLGLEPNGVSGREPLTIVQETFQRQPQRVGAGIDMDRSLLPQWRKLMVQSIRAKRVRVDRKRLESLIKDVRSGRIAREVLFDSPRMALPLVGRDGKPADSIKLSSIFYDYRVKSFQDFERRVSPWLIDDVIAATGTDYSDFIEPAFLCINRVAASLANRESDMTPAEAASGEQEWKDLRREGRCLVMIGYYLATYLDRRKYPHPGGHELFCGHIGPRYNPRTFSRPFGELRDRGEINIATFEDFESEVLSRMTGANTMLPFSPNLLSGVAELLFRLDLEQALRDKAPGVVDQLRSTGWID